MILINKIINKIIIIQNKIYELYIHNYSILIENTSLF